MADPTKEIDHMRKEIKAALVAGAGAAAIAAALSGAGTANASCASLNGTSIGKGCTSPVGSASVGAGQRCRERDSAGPGTLPSRSATPDPTRSTDPTQTTQADAQGVGNVAIAFGNGSKVGSLGNGDQRSCCGQGSNAFSYGGNDREPDTLRGQPQHLDHGGQQCRGRGGGQPTSSPPPSVAVGT